MVSDKDEENGISDGDKKGLSPPTEVQTAMMQELTPLSVQETSASTAREVTIKQVAPLVLILTGATFLNVSFPPSLKTNDLILSSLDHLCSIRSHYPSSNKQGPEYPRDETTMDRLSLCSYFRCIPTALWQVG
jgi:hypothetical protein